MIQIIKKYWKYLAVAVAAYVIISIAIAFIAPNLGEAVAYQAAMKKMALVKMKASQKIIDAQEASIKEMDASIRDLLGGNAELGNDLQAGKKSLADLKAEYVKVKGDLKAENQNLLSQVNQLEVNFSIISNKLGKIGDPVIKGYEQDGTIIYEFPPDTIGFYLVKKYDAARVIVTQQALQIGVLKESVDAANGVIKALNWEVAKKSAFGAIKSGLVLAALAYVGYNEIKK